MSWLRDVFRNLVLTGLIFCLLCLGLLSGPRSSFADRQPIWTLELIEWSYMPRTGTLTIYSDTYYQNPDLDYDLPVSALAEVNKICVIDNINLVGGKAFGGLWWFDTDINFIRIFHPTARWLAIFPAGSDWGDGSVAERWHCDGHTSYPSLAGIAVFGLGECVPVVDEHGYTVKYRCGDLLYFSEDLGENWYYMFSSTKLW